MNEQSRQPQISPAVMMRVVRQIISNVEGGNQVEPFGAECVGCRPYCPIERNVEDDAAAVVVHWSVSSVGAATLVPCGLPDFRHQGPDEGLQ